MAVLKIVLDGRVPPELFDDVTEQLAYASDRASSVRLMDDGSSVELALDDDADRGAAIASVHAIVRGMTRGYREVPSQVLWRHHAVPRNQAPIWDDLVAAGVLTPSGPGSVRLHGDACHVLAALDHKLAALGRSLGAVDHQYPTTICGTTLERCDYFSSFPHHSTFALHLREQLDALTQVAEATADARAQVVRDALAAPSHLLSPAVCFHTYAWLADRPLDQPVAVTAVGRCFRREATFSTLERLWDFSLRELVFAGDAAWVEDRRRQAMAVACEVVEQLGLDARIETAHDSFFVTRFAPRRFYQRLRQSKYELRFTLPYAGTSLAAASFNLHDEFFGRAFQITRGAGFATTGCAGFGLERWVWALFAQHGPRVADWPQATRQALGIG